LKPFDNPNGPRLSPMSQVRSVTYVSGPDIYDVVPREGLEPPTSVLFFSDQSPEDR
jgi:hypothetical protein